MSTWQSVGWRSAVGWVCVLALAAQLLVRPCVELALAALGTGVRLPDMSTEWITLILVPLLGLGGLRTVERMNGVASDQMVTPVALPVVADPVP